jgi:hypothetical protein
MTDILFSAFMAIGFMILAYKKYKEKEYELAFYTIVVAGIYLALAVVFFINFLTK